MDIHRHPCFNGAAKETYGRVHLPVAPKCNIQCRYCDHRYDCVSESRPGVSSAVLSPGQAMAYLDDLLQVRPEISVVGIAGPGDPFANAEQTMDTLRRVRKKYPEMLLCVATNGLELGPSVRELIDLDVSHVTVTVNAVDPAITAQMVSWVRLERRIFRGLAAGHILLEKQQRALEQLVASEMIVKVNTVVVPGINDEHLPDLGHYLRSIDVDLQNCIAVHPVRNTPFEHVDAPGAEQMHRLRESAGKFVKQMAHCRRCRADAAGLLTDHCSESNMMRPIESYARMSIDPSQNRPYVAVVSQEGLLVNLHLGEAQRFLIYEMDASQQPALVAVREAPQPGRGNERWEEVARILSDCSSLLVGDAGPRPTRVLTSSGLKILRLEGMIDELVPRAARAEDLALYEKVEKFSCGAACSGKGTGCM
jgi:nitrogen fixation protein NifB